MRAVWYIPSESRHGYADGQAYARALGYHQKAWLAMDARSAASFEQELHRVQEAALTTERPSTAGLAGEILGAWRSGFGTGMHLRWYLAYASLSAETETWEELLCELAGRVCSAVGQTGRISLDEGQFRTGLQAAAEILGSLSAAQAVKAFCESVEVDSGGNVAAVRNPFRDAIARVEELGYLPERLIPLAGPPHALCTHPELAWQVLLQSPALRGSAPDIETGVVDSLGLELLGVDLVECWFLPDPEGDCAKWFELGFCLGCLQGLPVLPERVVDAHEDFLGASLADGVDWQARRCWEAPAGWLRDCAERHGPTRQGSR